MWDCNCKHCNIGNKGVASGNWNGSLHEDRFKYLKREKLRQTMRANVGVKYLLIVIISNYKQLGR